MPAVPVPAAEAALGELAARAASLHAASGGDLLECFALVPDPRDPRGIRHSLPGILAMCTAAVLCGCTSLEDVTAQVASAGQETLAALGCRRNAPGICAPPHPDTIARVFTLLSAQDLAGHAGAYLACRVLPGPVTFPVAAPGWLPAIAVDGKAVRGAAGADGLVPCLLAAATHKDPSVITERLIGPKTSEVPEFAPLLRELNDRVPLAGHVITIDAGHTVRSHAELICGELGAHYVMTVEHASHCSWCLSWRVKESSLVVLGLDTEPFAASLGEVDGVELAALDLVQHGLAGDAEVGGGLAEGQPPVGGLGPEAVAELLVDADLPGCSRGELLAGDEAVAQPPVDGGAGDTEVASGFGDADHDRIVAAGCDIFGGRLVSGDAVVGAQCSDVGFPEGQPGRGAAVLLPEDLGDRLEE